MQALEDFVGGNTQILVGSRAFLETKEGRKAFGVCCVVLRSMCFCLFAER